MAEHSTLVGDDVHEPKGMDTASENAVYIADGFGSGVWTVLAPVATSGEWGDIVEAPVIQNNYVSGYIAFDATTPAYQHSVTTTMSPLNPTFALGEVNNFYGESSPNARLVYDGNSAGKYSIQFNYSAGNASGTDKDLETAIYINGTEVPGTRSIRTTSNGNWGNIAISCISELSNGDYIEVWVKADAAYTLDVAQAQLTVHSVIS